VENYPGFKKISGPDLAKTIEDHAREYDIDVEEAYVENIERNVLFSVTTKENKVFKAKTVILATGTKPRKLNVPGEDTYFGKGVHSCALCDGALYRNKAVGVVGGSDSAAKEALLLTQWAKKVYIIYRGEEIHPEPVNLARIQKAIKENKLEIIKNTNITEIKGAKYLNAVVLDNSHNNQKELPVDAVFVEIGHIPLSEIGKKIGVELNKKGEIVIDRNAQTNLPGFYAAGDVTDTRFKQAIVGVAEGVLAVFSAYKFITEN